jgi:hypothetical protein
MSLDPSVLRQHLFDDEAYTGLLTEALFASPEVKQLFCEARAVAERDGQPLRVRMFIGPSAPELHDIRWELLGDPEKGSALLSNEGIMFSRYLSSLDWRPVSVRPKTRLRAVVAIANPSDLGSFRAGGRDLMQIDVAGELSQARAALRGVELTELARPSAGPPATLDNLARVLREGPDILYLVCHGLLVRGEPWLLLEGPTGTADRVDGRRLAGLVREMDKRPRLVVLVSCQSAGDAGAGGEGALAALGPRLAEAGVPAVLAMQGDISMETANRFMPRFFEELRRDGHIDRAVAAARSAVRARPDWWVPVLFMRLKSGRIWYSPGFEKGFQKWPALIAAIKKGKCTPILGPGLTDALLGSRQDLARRWAETYHFPMSATDSEDLPQVAQYLAINQTPDFLVEELGEYIRKELKHRFSARLSEEVMEGSVGTLVSAVGELLRAEDPAEPHRVLAALPFPAFLTTDPADLLAGALRAEGKRPEVEMCRWSDRFTWQESAYQRGDFRPTTERPLVFHLFGQLQEPSSLVLTEDDHFDYLIGTATNRDAIPSDVRRAFTDTSLLFLGFRIDEWSFRVLFRYIVAQEGGGRRKQYPHVAVQIDPEESRTSEPERARQYLESYFMRRDISVYWGSVEDFIRELSREWLERTR